MANLVEADLKQEVRNFYDQVGWREVGDGVYQNARYEDLRPVSREYIHRCHLRLLRHFKANGKYFLDAGSGPIQYPEYLEYSKGYQARVCADISIVALREARQRIGDRQVGGHGLFVVADVASLPFRADIFEGLMALHTIHHLPIEEHRAAYGELYRVMAANTSAVVVNGWDSSLLMVLFVNPLRWIRRTRKRIQRYFGKNITRQALDNQEDPIARPEPKGTFVSKRNSDWLQREIGSEIPLEIRVWRSVSVRFLRAYIHPWLGGRWFLRLLYWLEERFPHFFGKYGQYPLIVICKSRSDERVKPVGYQV
jgi:ubiquinone/menaquinone biosynthesis C-methylase UbiE